MSTVFAVAAYTHDGLPTTQVSLDDGRVWVTQVGESRVGRLNDQIEELDGGTNVLGEKQFDVLQDGPTVFVHAQSTGDLRRLDVASVQLADAGATPLPVGSDVQLGGGTVAVLDPATGRLWVRSVDTVGSLKTGAGPRAAEADEPDAQVGKGAQVAVGQDGTVHALSVEDATVHTLRPGVSDEAAALPGVKPGSKGLALTAVGAEAVVLDRQRGQVLVGGHQVKVDGLDKAQLQVPGPAADAAVVAVADGFVRVPLDGSTTSSLLAGPDGTPIRPVVVAGCVRGAWSGSDLYAVDCGRGLRAQSLPEQVRGGDLVFRVNRRVAVLNDRRSGKVVVLGDTLKVVDNWDVVPKQKDDKKDNKSDAVTEQVEQALADRNKPNRPPRAENDDLGVRPGRTSTLPVLDNDSDPDGDLLTIGQPTPAKTSLGLVQPVTSQSQLQLTVPSRTPAGSSADIAYTVLDGRGGKASATARVTVRGGTENSPPVALQDSVAVVELGKAVTVRVLTDWRDPDGDDLVLMSAVTAGDDSVRSRPDGTVTFQDAGLRVGNKQVELTVTDNRPGSTPVRGLLTVTVKPAGNQPPVAVSDRVVTYVGRTEVVHPLANDTDPNGDDLRLVKVLSQTGLDVVPDFGAGAISVRATKAGSFYLTYVVTDGPSAVPGLVRVDVLDPTAANSPPVAVRDVALLPDGRSVLVDVLANDEDADGDVLLVQSVSAPPDSGLTVAVLEHRQLRITARGTLAAATDVNYTVTDGKAAATTSVSVVPIAQPTKLQPPTAVPDRALVRVGDVVTIHVLDNDTHPNGDELTLDRELAEPITPAQGLLFADGNVLRFQAPATPQTVNAVYTVRDSRGQAASARVSIDVLAKGARNTPPRPRDVVARAFAGATTRVYVPLDGIDPDGDAVSLVGPVRPPALSRISKQGVDWFEVEAFAASAGTDTFTYLVRDSQGGEGTASIRLGIAARSGNQAPVAFDDEAIVRTGRIASVPALDNDTDPDGDVVTYAEPALDVPAGVQASLTGRTISVRSPASGAAVTLPYTIQDTLGLTSTAFVTVRAGAAAPLLPPIARDDVVTSEQALGKTLVEVPVLDNDDDPDGTRSALKVALVQPDRGSVNAGGVLTVPLRDQVQVLAYSVTDADNLAGYAFVRVPALTETGAPPVLRPGLPPFQVETGKELRLALVDLVVVRPGRTGRLTETKRATATNSDGQEVATGPTSLRFVSKADYAGPASVTFEVTDGSGPEDPKGMKAVLTVPIQVTPSPDAPGTPPTFQASSLTVAAGEAPATLDLRRATTDPDSGDLDKLVFTAPNQVPGFTASLSGNVLTVTADARTSPGAAGVLSMTVTDGSTPPQPVSVRIAATASTRPLAKVADPAINDAVQGKPVTVDVLAGSFNPYPDTPLRVTPASLTGGDGQISTSGSKVTLTPSSSFVGQLTATFAVTDKTESPSRQVQGRITATVLGRPDAPGTPQVDSVEDRTVRLTWPAPTDNGARIDHYQVTAKNFSQQCPGTTCSLTGLSNDTEYVFTVTATNRVGTSEPSPSSAVARPDVRPDKPAPPTLTFGDRALDVAFVAPANRGSKISAYDLELDAGAGAATVTDTRHTFTGLNNGQSYRVRVRADNASGSPSDWSEYSQPQTPAGVPEAPGTPGAEKGGGAVGQQVSVGWSPPRSDNGDAISAYTLSVFKNGGLTQTLPLSPQTTSQTITAENGSDYTFSVTATNKAGESAASAQSAPVRPSGQPAQVGAVSAAPGDHKATLAFSAPSDNGEPISRYEWRSSGASGSLGLSGKEVVGLTNGTAYRFDVRACNSYCGEWSASSNEVMPFGKPNQPSASASGGAKNVTFNWGPPGTNGRPIDHLVINIDGRGEENVPAAGGSRAVGDAYDETHSIAVYAVDSESQRSSVATGSAKSGPRPPPPPVVVVSRGDSAVGKPGCSDPSCAYVVVEIRNFAAGTYNGQLSASYNSYAGSEGRFTINANERKQTQWFYGYSGKTVCATVNGVQGCTTW